MSAYEDTNALEGPGQLEGTQPLEGSARPELFTHHALRRRHLAGRSHGRQPTPGVRGWAQFAHPQQGPGVGVPHLRGSELELGACHEGFEGGPKTLKYGAAFNAGRAQKPKYSTIKSNIFSRELYKLANQ